MRTSLILDALTMARSQHGIHPGTILHSDHGAQYTSSLLHQWCTRHHVRQSMGRTGGVGIMPWPNYSSRRSKVICEVMSWSISRKPGAGTCGISRVGTIDIDHMLTTTASHQRPGRHSSHPLHPMPQLHYMTHTNSQRSRKWDWATERSFCPDAITHFCLN